VRRKIFGVVIPIPPDLARRIDRVRRFYDSNFRVIGPHVTVLPPRPLTMTPREVAAEVGRIAERTAPLTLILGKIATFHPVMPVVFARFRRGRTALARLHRKLAQGTLKGPEAFPYFPHVTLGQNLNDGRLGKAQLLSRKTLSGPAAILSWRADSLVIVERQSRHRWVSLPSVPLRCPARKTGRSRRRVRGSD